MEFKEKIDPQHTVLLIVDMQNDYCHPEGALGSNGFDVSSLEATATSLSLLIEAARQSGTKIIFVKTTHDEWTDSPVRKDRPLFQSMYICRTGSWGAEYYQNFPQSEDLEITKNRYSAFINTSLDLTLRSIEIKTLIVTGTATNVCVDCTVRDAFQHDFYVVVPSDCTATSNPQIQEAAIANFERFYGDVTTSDKIMEVWKNCSE